MIGAWSSLSRSARLNCQNRFSQCTLKNDIRDKYSIAEFLILNFQLLAFIFTLTFDFWLLKVIFHYGSTITTKNWLTAHHRTWLKLHFCKWHFPQIFTQPHQIRLFLLVFFKSINGFKHSGTMFLRPWYHYLQKHSPC